MADEAGAGITEETLRPPQPQEESVLTPKAPEAKEPTPLQKWLDSLEEKKPDDQKTWDEIMHERRMKDRAVSGQVVLRAEEADAIEARMNNSYLKRLLPQLLEDLRQPEAIDHPLSYLVWEAPEDVEIPARETGASFEAFVHGYDNYPEGLVQKVEEAISNGNLVAIAAILEARLNYLGRLEGIKELQERYYWTAKEGYISKGKPLSNSEREELDRYGQEVAVTRNVTDILGRQFGADTQDYHSWEDVVKAPVGSNPPQPVAKAA